jgi:hypothetical protein
MTQFFWGATAALCAVAALFFFKFWRRTGDGLFAAFAAGFGALSVHWTALALIHPPSETRHYLYFVRLVAFGLIIAGVIDKNRASPRPRTPTLPGRSSSAGPGADTHGRPRARG